MAHRSAHLTAYQDATLTERYLALVAKVRQRTEALGVSERLPRIVAHVYANLLAYKDEYEVARLFADPAFEAQLKAQFDGDYTIAFHLAPPMIPGKDANGRPKKRRFGRWMMPAFRTLARFKWLRGTPSA